MFRRLAAREIFNSSATATKYWRDRRFMHIPPESRMGTARYAKTAAISERIREPGDEIYYIFFV